MILLYENKKVVGVENGDITQLFTPISNPQRIPIDDDIIVRLNDLDDPLHASHLTVKNGKIIVPKTIPESDRITSGN